MGEHRELWLKKSRDSLRAEAENQPTGLERACPMTCRLTFWQGEGVGTGAGYQLEGPKPGSHGQELSKSSAAELEPTKHAKLEESWS